jgi:hypothetical protein
MSFLSKLGKDLGTAAEKARFEADKALKLNRLGSELGTLNGQLQQVTASIGDKVMELRAAGQLNVPELEELFSQVETTRAQIAAKQAEIDAVKAQQFGMAAAPAEPTPTAAPTAPVEAPPATTPAASAEAAPIPKFCPNCGMATQGAKFCPNCGQQLG